MYFSVSNFAGVRLLTWHRLLWDSDPQLPTGVLIDWPDLGRPISPGERADLRRCVEPADAAFCSAFVALTHAVQPDAEKRAALLSSRYELPALCRVAIAGSQIKTADLKTRFAVQAAQFRENTDQPRVSPDRWTALVRQPDPDEALRLLLRILPLIGRSANLIDVADAVSNWTDKTRRDLALQYFDRSYSAAA